jgi:hypothetical protein
MDTADNLTWADPNNLQRGELGKLCAHSVGKGGVDTTHLIIFIYHTVTKKGNITPVNYAFVLNV